MSKKVGWTRCLIRVRFNCSLDAWVRFPTWARNFKLFGPDLNSVKWGDLHSRGRLNLHWIDFSTYKVIVKPTKWSNSIGELAHWKLHSMNQDSMSWRTWLSSARGYTWVGKICTSSKGSIIQLNHDWLGSGYWPKKLCKSIGRTVRL